VAERVHKALTDIHAGLSEHDLISGNEIVDRIMCHDGVCEITTHKVDKDMVSRWLSLSKALSANKLGEWGRASSPNVKTRGVKDYSYLVMRRHGSPMHFREVAAAINKTFGKSVHVATTHNELIKDARFVLVGRGVYALKEWGYKTGVVRDVIADILKAEGPMTKEDVVEKVMKERYLKKNTILVNLQNPKYFKKNKDGNYTVA
jgi:DNA-directed RNA polymerase delta subunit